ARPRPEGGRLTARADGRRALPPGEVDRTTSPGTGLKEGTIMAKGSGRKRSKKSADMAAASRTRAARLAKALAAGLKREAKAASRFEAAQLEVAVLRMALAEVVGEESAEPAPVAATRVEVLPEPKREAARQRPAKAPAAAKPAVAKKPAVAANVPPTRPRRTTRPAPADR
ncbi:MAG: hypothetical protein V2B17_07170, partial [Chloroflexota bacterium]